ncbi:ABC transporter substrate-binding protein [Oceanospirillum beijerinckii]|uniref:ABC transporter substrate-binding protein n=1 Tax=Oceanospirillum beijerinckii TaxID=64976 RepID=UPI00040FA03A|nr:ABC transporter substrate-binding protein [Oceanospirillum beijerinckii]
MRKTLVSLGLSTTLGLTATSALAECGEVTISDMNWTSASFLANLDKFILEEGFGCSASLIPGDTVPTSTSMIEKGEPDIAPEMWTNSVKESIDNAVKGGDLHYAGQSLSDGGEEGFWVPKYLVDQYPELATIEGVKKHAKLFEHPEDPEKSMFMGCPAGWACQISSANLYQALGLKDAGFTLVDPGSSAGLTGSIAKSYERKEGWFGYYWAPTAVMGRYPMVKVDFGSGVQLDHFMSCITQKECTDPKPSMFPPSPVWTVTTTSFKQKAPEAFAYLNSRSMSNAQMNELLAWMEENQADGEYAAYHFLTEYESIWSDWVPADVAKKIKKAL